MKRLFYSLSILIIFSVGSFFVAQEDTDILACDNADSELMLTAINAYRVDEALTPFVVNDDLCTIARRYVREVATNTGDTLPDAHLEENLTAAEILAYPDGYVAELKVFITRDDTPDSIVETLLTEGGDLGIDEFRDYFGATQYREMGLVHLENTTNNIRYYIFIALSQPNILPIIVANPDDLYLSSRETDTPSVQVLLHNEQVSPNGDLTHVGNISTIRLSQTPRETGILIDTCSISDDEGIDFQNVVEYTLSGGLGLKTIYVEMCDIFGTMVVSSVEVILTSETGAVSLNTVTATVPTSNPDPNTTTIKLFIDDHSLTLFVPDDKPVSLEGLVFETNNSTYELTSYSSFAGIPLNPAFAPACFRLLRNGESVPLPGDCPTNLTITHQLARSDVFWYQNARYIPIQIKIDENIQGICQGDNAVCEITVSESEETREPSCIDIAQSRILESNEAWIQVRNSRNDCVENGMVLVPIGTDTEAFWIDQYEVSQAEYARCDHSDCATIIVDNANHPVAGITIEQAEAYCIWRGTDEPGITRLPTTEEWQYAAQGVDGWLYPWGNDSTGIEDKAIFETSSQGSPANVDDELENSASWVGAYHMVGNIIEWVKSGSKSKQVGGSFRDTEGNIRTTFMLEANTVFDEAGFRCMREIDV